MHMRSLARYVRALVGLSSVAFASLAQAVDPLAFQEVGGQVVMEGENYSTATLRTDPNNIPWAYSTYYGGTTGGYIAVAEPGGTDVVATWANGAEITYDIDFYTAGTYNVWVRRYISNSASNSVCYGLDHFQATGNDGGTDYNSWKWKKLGTITVTPGRRVFQFRRAESRYRIDRIILTTSATTPTGAGPAESQRLGPYTEADPEHLFGVNMAGLEFGGSSLEPSQASIDHHAAKGMQLIRVPFKWERIQPALNGALNATEIAKVDRAISKCTAKGQKVILDMHNYGAYGGAKVGTATVPYSAFGDVWLKLAQRYGANATVVGYGLMNEPNGMASGTWPTAAQTAIDSIRTVDTNMFIYVGGENWSHASDWPTSNPLLNLTDPADRIVYEAHCYFDDTQGGIYDETYDDEGASPNRGVDRLRPFVEWLLKKNGRGFIGEYAIPRAAPGDPITIPDDPRWDAVLDNFLAYMQENGISGTYWAAGGRWSGSYAMRSDTRTGGVDAPQWGVLQNRLTGNGGVGTGTGVQAIYYSNADFTGTVVSRPETTIDFDWAAGAPTGTGFDGDTWSARWIGKIKAPTSGDWTFYANADESVRVWINGLLVIDGWTGGGVEKSGTLFLRAGLKYDLRIEYAEQTGNAYSQLRWSGPDVPKEIVPSNQLYAEGDGLFGSYYDNTNFTTLMAQRVDSIVNFNYGTNAPMPSMGVDSWSTRWQGRILAPATGAFTLWIRSDDGIRLWVNGVQLINAWTGGGAERSAVVNMTAGETYEIKLEYYENNQHARCELRWEGPGITKSVLPEANLFSAVPFVMPAINIQP